MKKGFVFSLDAALALTVVMAAMITLLLFFQAGETNADAFPASRAIASDSAVVGFYLGKSATEMGLSAYIPGNAKDGSCSSAFDYVPEADGTKNGPTEKKYCKWVE